MVGQLAGVQCAGNPHFWVNEDGSYQEEGQKNTRGYIWGKVTSFLLFFLDGGGICLLFPSSQMLFITHFFHFCLLGWNEACMCFPVPASSF